MHIKCVEISYLYKQTKAADEEELFLRSNRGGGGIEENVEFRNEFLEGITSYLKSCNQLNFLVTRHFELLTSYAKIDFLGL